MSQGGGRGAGREGGPGCRAAGWGAVRVGVRVALCSAATSELRFSVKWTGPAWGLPRGPPVLGGGGRVVVRPGGSSGFWPSLPGRKLCSPRPPTGRPFAYVEKLLQRLGAEARASRG